MADQNEKNNTQKKFARELNNSKNQARIEQGSGNQLLDMQNQSAPDQSADSAEKPEETEEQELNSRQNFHLLKQIGKIAAEAAVGYDVAATKNAALLARDVGKILKEKIDQGQFNGFFIALILALTKDLWDVFEFTGLTAWLANIVISISLFIIITFQGIWFKRWLTKKFLGRMIISNIAEYIPGFSIFPWYTISILLIRHGSQKEVKKNEEALKELNKISKK